MSDIYVARSVPTLAARQHGVLTRAQALAAGVNGRMIDRRLARGDWERLYPAVYRLAGAPATWRQSLLAAVFAWGDGAVVSHRAAGALREIVGCKPCIELTVPRGRERGHNHLVHRPRALQPVDVTTVDAIPVTTAARTLIDLATCLDEDVLEEALDDALRRRLTTVARLRWRMGEVGARTTLQCMVDARVGAVPESVLETRVLRALRKAGLPKPRVQHYVGHYRVDFAYPDARIAIEADGFAWHSSHRQLERDAARRNALIAMGWTVVHVTWEQLGDEAFVDVVRALLTDRRSTGSSTGF